MILLSYFLEHVLFFDFIDQFFITVFISLSLAVYYV
jgi:hypothetical protein